MRGAEAAVSSRRPTFSVVMATRDRPDLLADALRSIAAQRLRPYEVRIGDDGARPLDDDPSVARGVAIVRVRCAGAGAAAARNHAAAGAAGDVIAFLDDDDRWAPDHLAGLAEALADQGVELAYRDAAVVRERIEPDGRRIELERRFIARDWDPGRMRTDDYLPPSAIAIRRGLFERLGGFDESFRYSEDWDLLLRAAAVTTPRRVPGATVEVRLRPSGNASSDQGSERADCLRRLALRHRLPPLIIKTFWEVAATVGTAEQRS